MKKLILFALLALIVVTTLSAQALSLDSRKVPIQFPDNFSVERFTCSADTVYSRVTVPSYAIEAWIIGETGAVHVNPDSTYATVAPYIAIPAATPFTLPVKNETKFFVRRAAAGTATILNIVWKKL